AQAPGEVDETLLVRYAEESPAGGNHPYYRMAMERMQLSLRWPWDGHAEGDVTRGVGSGRGSSPASCTRSGTTSSHPIGIKCTPRTPSIFLSALIVRTAKRVGGRADEDLGGVLQLVSAPQDPGVSQSAEGRDHLFGVQVEDGLRVLLVSRGRRVAPEAEDIVDSEGRGPEEIRLEADAVSVSRDHLHDRFDAFLQSDQRAGQGG